MNAIPPEFGDHGWTLMLRYLDGTLPEDQVAELNSLLKNDPEMRTQFEDLLLQQIKLREIVEEERATLEETAEEVPANVVEFPVETPVGEKESTEATHSGARHNRGRAPVRRRRLGSVLGLAASIALVGALLWFFFMPARLATLSMADPGVIVERGSFKLAAESGMAIRVGDRIVTPLDGRAMFSYDKEMTEVTVDTSTRLGVDFIRDSKQLTLDRGTFSADVAKQDPDHPLGLVTPEAEAIVVGTRFKLSTTRASTRLEVFEGAIRISRTQEGPSMQVPAGHFVDVQPGLPVSLRTIPKTGGTVTLEQWTDETPGETNQTTLSQMMYSSATETTGGSRVRGYVHPPLTGSYTFELNANSAADLRLSDSSDPGGAKSVVEISEDAGVDRATSDGVTLKAGQSYYFELDCEPDGDPLQFTVSWRMPGGKRRVLYGEYLSPFNDAQALK